MSFTTMNGVNAAGGMMGTTRAPLRLGRVQPAPVPQQPQFGQAVPGGAARSLGRVPGGMQGSMSRDPIAASTIRNGVGGHPVGGSVNAAMAGGMGADGVAGGRSQRPNDGGVVTGAVGQALGQPRAPAFDPNDPRNAALAGYMAQ
jgi:hypothetical protein